MGEGPCMHQPRRPEASSSLPALCPRLGLALTLVGGDQQVQRLLGQIGPDGHHLLPQLGIHLLFVSSACEWEQRGISWTLGKLQSHGLLLIQALGSSSPAGPGPLKDCVGDSPASRGTDLVPTYQLCDMGVSLPCCALVCPSLKWGRWQ